MLRRIDFILHICRFSKKCGVHTLNTYIFTNKLCIHLLSVLFILKTPQKVYFYFYFFLVVEFSFFLFFFLWWILSYIEMKQPRVYMCSPSQPPLPPPSPPIPSRFSQCTRSERLSHASNLGCDLFHPR